MHSDTRIVSVITQQHLLDTNFTHLPTGRANNLVCAVSPRVAV